MGLTEMFGSHREEVAGPEILRCPDTHCRILGTTCRSNGYVGYVSRLRAKEPLHDNAA